MNTIADSYVSNHKLIVTHNYMDNDLSIDLNNDLTPEIIKEQIADWVKPLYNKCCDSAVQDCYFDCVGEALTAFTKWQNQKYSYTFYY
jgi:hypothetical protein